MKHILILTALLLVPPAASHAAEPLDMAKRAEELKSLRWGMFICWSFSTFSGKEWTPGVTDVSFFKATGCDTDQWARTAKDAGMGYILFLTKHHDGFCLWDTKTTDRKATKSPLGRDVLAALRKSCDKHGIKLALYFSEGDWTWPGAADGKGWKAGIGKNPEMKKAQLKELLTQYGPVEYIWFDHAVGDGGLSHKDTIAWCKSFQPGCFIGFNHGDQTGADIRLGEMGRPGPLDDHAAAGPHMKDAPSKSYRLAEFTYPILPPHKGGAMWFYSLPIHDALCLPAEKLYRDYLGAVKFGNVFALDVGPDYAGRLREVDVRTLRKVGGMIRSNAPDPSVPPPLAMPPPAQPVPAKIEIADGPFKPTWDSLKQYKCPDWFRDAKLGIWGILGPQSLPEAGDWYARHMYVEGSAQYLFHLDRFGHPSQFGYKDLAAMWKAGQFDPDRLMTLYKKAGAKYFVVLANHHDNWDNWNSKFHRWNAVNVGPKKDIVGLWAQAARKHGLRFGVTEHLARSYSWFNTNKGSDKKGPLAGVPYDGADPKLADLYFPPHEDTISSYPKDPPEWWTRQWFWRMRDLLDTYKPDLMYSDGAVPFGEVGRSLFAHYYNANMAWHGGKLEAVYNIKDLRPRTDHGDYVEGVGVQDVERGGLGEIKPEPWQTDTCIGDWFYKTGLTYKSAKHVIAMLADIVSKNGNLLLNVPLKHDGTIDAGEEKVLGEMAGWIALHGEAIYGTRPWLVFGEGPARKGGTHFNEGVFAKMTARDIRFTTKDGALYAIAMGWPDSGKLVVRSLAAPAGKIERVTLLGHDGKLLWTQTDDGLVVTMPDLIVSEDAIALKIISRDLKPVPVTAAPAIQSDKDGCFILRAAEATIHGDTPRYESSGGKDQIGYWGKADDFVSWDIKLAKPATYTVEVTYSCAAPGSEFTVEVGDQKLTGKSASTSSWAAYRTDKLGTLKFDTPGVFTLAVVPKAEPKWKVIGLKSVTLKPIE